jgi:peptide/nickel transport system substrate-binding protein
MHDRMKHLARPRRVLAVAAALLGIAMVQKPAMAAEAPQRGGTMVAVIGADPAVLTPSITVGAPDLFVGCMIYEGLIRYGEGFKIMPELAKSWDISSDGLTYTFHLEKASFSDGQPVTSEDVKFSLTQASAKFGPHFTVPGGYISDIATPDAQTVVIKLSRPFAPFLFSLACEQNAPILPAHIFQGSDILKSDATLSKPVGSGPFELTDWVRGDHLTLERNPNFHHEGQPYLDKIVVKIMPDSAARILALRSGEIDFIDEYYFPLSAYQQFASDPNYVLKDVGFPGDDLIIINTKRPRIDDPKVCQALLTAIDRNFVHKSVFFVVGGVAVSSFDTRLAWAYNPAVNYEKMYPYDPKRAAQLLDEAGVKAGPDGTRFSMSLSFDSGRPEYTSLAQALQRYWQDVGIKVVLDGAERPVVLKRVYSDYDFDTTLQNYTTSGDPVLGIARLYVTSSIKQGTTFNNAARYSNPEIDDLFLKGQNRSTQEDRAEVYFKVQEVLARDLPVLTIHQQPQIDVATSHLKDLFLGASYIWWSNVWMQN